MKSTTIRFADPVYERLEAASRATGLPINSIVVVACLDWLRQGRSQVPAGALPRLDPRGWLRSSLPVAARPLRLGDPLHLFTSTAQDVLAHAQAAAERERSFIGTAHLLRGLLEVAEGRAARALRGLGLDREAVLGQLEPEPGGPPAERALPTSRLRRVIRRAREESGTAAGAQVGSDHLLLGILLEGESQVAEALEAAGVTVEAVREALAGLGPED